MKLFCSLLIVIGVATQAEQFDIIVKPAEKKEERKEEPTPLKKTRVSLAAYNDTGFNFDVLIHIEDVDNPLRVTAIRSPVPHMSVTELGVAGGPPNTTFELKRLDVKIGEKELSCHQHVGEGEELDLKVTKSIFVYIHRATDELWPTCTVFIDKDFLSTFAKE